MDEINQIMMDILSHIQYDLCAEGTTGPPGTIISTWTQKHFSGKAASTLYNHI